MLLETCWFDPVRPESCPLEPTSLTKCIVPTTMGELCDANGKWAYPTENINNCGASDVYTTNCGGTNLVQRYTNHYNPYFEIFVMS